PRAPTGQSDRSLPMTRTPSSGQLVSPPIPPAVETLRQPRQPPSNDRSLRQVPSRDQGLGVRPPSSRGQSNEPRPFGSSPESQRLGMQPSRSDTNQFRPDSAGTSTSSNIRGTEDSPPRQRNQ